MVLLEPPSREPSGNLNENFSFRVHVNRTVAKIRDSAKDGSTIGDRRLSRRGRTTRFQCRLVLARSRVQSTMSRGCSAWRSGGAMENRIDPGENCPILGQAACIYEAQARVNPPAIPPLRGFLAGCADFVIFRLRSGTLNRLTLI